MSMSGSLQLWRNSLFRKRPDINGFAEVLVFYTGGLPYIATPFQNTYSKKKKKLLNNSVNDTIDAI
jgi:hypothetical protein